jgi:hypothetical protein
MRNLWLALGILFTFLGFYSLPPISNSKSRVEKVERVETVKPVESHEIVDKSPTNIKLEKQNGIIVAVPAGAQVRRDIVVIRPDREAFHKHKHKHKKHKHKWKYQYEIVTEPAPYYDFEED